MTRLWQGWRRPRGSTSTASWERVVSVMGENFATVYNTLMEECELKRGPGTEEWEYQFLPAGELPKSVFK